MSAFKTGMKATFGVMAAVAIVAVGWPMTCAVVGATMIAQENLEAERTKAESRKRHADMRERRAARAEHPVEPWVEDNTLEPGCYGSASLCAEIAAERKSL